MIDTNTWIGVALASIYLIEKIYMKQKKSKCEMCCLKVETEAASPKVEMSQLHINSDTKV